VVGEVFGTLHAGAGRSQAALRVVCEILWGLGERNVHFRVTALRGRLYGGNHPFNVSPQGRPLLVPENHKSDFPALQILLVKNVFVGCRQDLKACRLSDRGV